MDKSEKEKIIKESEENIEEISKSLNVDGTKTKEYIKNLDDTDLKIIKELNSVIKMFNKPFWKIAFWIILISSIINIMYQIGVFIGKFIALIS